MWDNVLGLYEPVERIFLEWNKQFRTVARAPAHTVAMVAAAAHFVASYHKVQKKPSTARVIYVLGEGHGSNCWFRIAPPTLPPESENRQSKPNCACGLILVVISESPGLVREQSASFLGSSVTNCTGANSCKVRRQGHAIHTGSIHRR